MMPAERARALTASKRRALVRSALGPLSYRVPSDAVATFAAACELDDAAGLYRAAASWAEACRAALDDGRELPTSAELARDDAARIAAAELARDRAALDDAAGL